MRRCWDKVLGQMTAAILSIGTELTRGEIVNTNAAWLSAELTAAGFNVGEVLTIADDLDRMIASMQLVAGKHRLLVLPGGL